MNRYAIGLDYGTNSVRALLVDTISGEEIADAVYAYEHGVKGVILANNPNLARQHPNDYLIGAVKTIRQVLSTAREKLKDFNSDQVIGVGVDTTGSTPMPVDEKGRSLVEHECFKDDLDAMVWLWKDHTSIDEAAEITALATQMRPQYLTKCGGVYSSEWFFSKILHCSRVAPRVFDAAYLWVEIADWIPAVLTGTEHPDRLTVGICAAGHKGMYNESWGGYPDVEFLGKLDPRLADLRSRLRTKAYSIKQKVGGISKEWADKTGLKEGTPVAVGAFDAHLGAVGCGIEEGTLVKIIGTSTCDITVVSNQKHLPDIPGLCGIVNGSVLPGFYGLEAGQSAVGDIFNWFVDYIEPAKGKLNHRLMDEEAAKLAAGESGLLALDWNNGNRTILVDQRLTGVLLGQTLYTSPVEIYRALVEATAYGALTIINRFEEYGVKINQVVNCGGISEKSPLAMQIYADVTGRPMKVSRSAQTCALGAAIAGAVAAGKPAGGYDNFADAQKAMTGLKPNIYVPDPKAAEVYKKLYSLYKQLHDAFGTKEYNGNLYNVMKDLITIRNQNRK